jgi:hypothetical protein
MEAEGNQADFQNRPLSRRVMGLCVEGITQPQTTANPRRLFLHIHSRFIGIRIYGYLLAASAQSISRADVSEYGQILHRTFVTGVAAFLRPHWRTIANRGAVRETIVPVMMSTSRFDNGSPGATTQSNLSKCLQRMLRRTTTL